MKTVETIYIIIIFQTIVKIVCLTTLLKSHFGMGVLRQICCIFSEHPLLRIPWATASGHLYHNYSEHVDVRIVMLQSV